MKKNFKPEGWNTVTPRIVAYRAKELVEFVKQVFVAEGDYHSDRPTDLKIGDSVIMISEAGVRKPSPAFLYIYVSNADETYQRAIQAGAKSMERPTDTPYGDRRAMVEDQWGNVWQIATFRSK